MRMNIQNIIDSAISLAKTYTPQQVEHLEQLQTSARRPTLSVAVLGDFKAGKSTLINRVFLNENLLPVDVLEATAVPTYLSSGEPLLQVWQREADGSETLASETRNYTDAELAAAVTASSAEARAEKAERFSRVVLQKPGILPEGITLIDTPGLNTPNTRILVGTLEEARKADAVLYVVRQRQLSAAEKERIADLAGKQTLKLPVHIVLTIDSSIAPGQVDELRETLVAQASSVGVACGVSVFDFEAGQNRSVAINNGLSPELGDWMSEYIEIPVESSGAGDIAEELVAFFNGKVRQGRDARICRDLRPLLLSIETAIESRLALSDRNAEQLDALKAKLAEQHEEYQRVVRNLLMDVRTAQVRFANGVEENLDDIRDAYIKELGKQNDIGGVKECLTGWVNDMPARLQRTLELAKYDMIRDISDISAKYKVQLEKTLISNISPDLKIELGPFVQLVEKVPTSVIYILDGFITVISTPFPWKIDIALRFLAGIIPGIKELLPVNILRRMAVNTAVKKLRNSMAELKQKMSEQLITTFEQMQKKLEEDLTQNSVFTELDAAMEEARNGILTPEQIAELQKAKDEVKAWGASL